MDRGWCRRGEIVGAFIALALAVPASGVVEPAADAPPLERVRTIAPTGPVGGLDHLAFDVCRGRLFVANTAGSTLDSVDLKAGKLLWYNPKRQAAAITRASGFRSAACRRGRTLG